MEPVVIVTSFGNIKPSEIIKSIITYKNVPTHNDISSSTCDCNLYQIKTKYFDTTIKFIPIEQPLSVPTNIIKKVECFIVYFNSKNKSILKELPKLFEMVKDNNISLCMFLTDKLSVDPNLGLTYEEMKGPVGIVFDVIELYQYNINKKCEFPIYDDVIEVLHNHVWSTVKNKYRKCSDHNLLNEGLEPIESQLEEFEELLASIQNFKEVSATLKRNEILDEADKLAEVFERIISEE